MTVIPSILVQTENDFIREISSVQDILNLVQIDIADGKFVPQTTWTDPDVIQKHLKIECELHLMVADPLKELKRWQKVEQVVRILVHYESVPDFKAILPTLHAYGWEIGIVLNPDTPIDAIMPFVNDIKSVMFMGVNPGKQGQKLIPEVLTKIKKFSTLYPDMFTELDGAVNEETLPEIIKSGVKAICPGSAVFKNGRTAKENIQSMEKIILQLKG